MNLAGAFAGMAAQRGAQTALFWGDQEISYTSLLEQTRAVARLLVAKLGVKRGDRVGLWLRNGPEFVPALFGVLEAGAAVVPINNFLKPDEVSFILGDAGIDLLISEAALGEGFPKLTAVRPSLRFLRIEDFPRETGTLLPAPAGSAQPTDRDLAVIIYTSGTTGHPKGAMLSHGNLLHNVESCRQVLMAVKEDRFVAVLPMFHSFMLTVCVFLPLLVGGSIVLVKSVHPPKNVVAEILRRRGTILPAVPPFFRALLNAQVTGELPLPSLFQQPEFFPQERTAAFFG